MTCRERSDPSNPFTGDVSASGERVRSGALLPVMDDQSVSQRTAEMIMAQSRPLVATIRRTEPESGQRSTFTSSAEARSAVAGRIGRFSGTPAFPDIF